MEWRKHSSRLKEDFDRDGYVIIEGFLRPAEAAEVNAQVDRYIAEVLPGLPGNAAFYEVKGDPETMLRLQDMASHDPYFAELYHSEGFSGLGAMLLGDKAVATNMQWFNKPARIGRETPPHQDGFYFMLEPNEALTLWLALDPVDQENGCVRYVPGSHRQGMRPKK